MNISNILQKIASVFRIFLIMVKYMVLYPFTRPNKSIHFLKYVGKYIEKASMHIPTVSFFEVFPEASEETVLLENLNMKLGNVSIQEEYYIAAMVKILQPKRVFEFGTFDGCSTLQMALNSPHAKIYTLDLPMDNIESILNILPEPDEKCVLRRPKVKCFHNHSTSDRIIQLVGDSRTFDFSAFIGKIDFVFVDGAHSMNFVKSDTENALKMLSQNGIIVWHDYARGCPGVYNVLNKLNQSLNLSHILETTLVVGNKQLSKKLR